MKFEGFLLLKLSLYTFFKIKYRNETSALLLIANRALQFPYNLWARLD